MKFEFKFGVLIFCFMSLDAEPEISLDTDINLPVSNDNVKVDESNQSKIENAVQEAVPVKVEDKPQEAIKVVQEKQVEPEKKENQIDEEIGQMLDTLDIEESGNWLLKRVWWEQAESVFEKIINLNDSIIKTQMDYFDKRNEADKALNLFYRSIGYEQGELNETIDYLISESQKEREVLGDLTIEEREFLELLNEKKKELEQLKSDLKELSQMDGTLTATITQVIDQVNRCRSYEKDAWASFKEIGRSLDDKKARTLFYQAETDFKNIQNISRYLKQDLMNYFQSLLGQIAQFSNNISSKIDSLKKEGFDLQERSEMLKRADEVRKQNKQMEANKSGPDKQKTADKSWFGRIKTWFKSTFKI